MAGLKEVLESVVPTERGIYTGETKPKEYCTFQTVLRQPKHADDEPKEWAITYRVTLFSKGKFENTLQKILDALKKAEYYINSVDGESYDTDTGYWVIPVNIQYLKE